MDDFMKAQLQLQLEKDKLTERLVNILVKHDVAPYSAWFNWNKPKTLVWGDCSIPMGMLKELMDEFGEIECVYSPKMSDKLFIKFRR